MDKLTEMDQKIIGGKPRFHLYTAAKIGSLSDAGLAELDRRARRYEEAMNALNEEKLIQREREVKLLDLNKDTK